MKFRDDWLTGGSAEPAPTLPPRETERDILGRRKIKTWEVIAAAVVVILVVIAIGLPSQL